MNHGDGSSGFFVLWGKFAINTCTIIVLWNVKLELDRWGNVPWRSFLYTFPGYQFWVKWKKEVTNRAYWLPVLGEMKKEVTNRAYWLSVLREMEIEVTNRANWLPVLGEIEKRGHQSCVLVTSFRGNGKRRSPIEHIGYQFWVKWKKEVTN